MAKGPFKMKGSPMQRNFGINSPLREDKPYKKPDNWEEMTDEERSKWVVGQQKDMLRRTEKSTGKKFGRSREDLQLYEG